MKQLFLFLLVVICLGQVHPQGGKLDSSFAHEGIAVTDFGAAVNINNDLCQQMLLKADGSFFLVFEMNEQSMITHRLPDGALDKTYGNNGYSKAVFMRDPSAVLQPDGKIILGGFSMVNNSLDYVLARFNTNGSPDLSFSGDGVVSFDFSSSTDHINDVGLQTDGKIIAVGYSNLNTKGYMSLARLNADGSFDSSFSDDGKLMTDITSMSGSANAVAIQTDGKIVVAGNAETHIMIARFLANGVFDNSFSADGTTFISTGRSSMARDVVVQPDGKIVIAGSVAFAGDDDFLLMRLFTDGTPDFSFSTDSKQYIDFGADERIQALALQTDGKMVAAGSTSTGTEGNFAIARFNADGSADNSFSSDGKQTTSISTGADFAFDVALQPNGDILVAGWSLISDGVNYTVVRYLPNGSPDLSFADRGIMVDYMPSGYAEYRATTMQTDGKIIAVGLANTGNSIQFAAVRYYNNGLLDTSFGQNGKQRIDFGLGSSMACDVALQPDGKLILAGYVGEGSECYFALARLNANGSVDSSFDGDGRVVLDRFAIGVTIGQYAKMVIQPDGKIIVAGSTESQLTGDIVLVRCLSNGTVDAGFGIGGTVITDLGSPSDKAFALRQQRDGKLVIVGDYDHNNNSKVAVMRYSKDGVPDISFGTQGIVVTNISQGRDAAFAAALQADGKIVAAGNVTTNEGDDLLLVRYNIDGSLDNSFSQDGKLVFDMGSTSEAAQALIVQDNGKIITAGFTHDGRGNVSAIACFNPDGTFDSSFSLDGKIIGEPDRALLYGVAINADRLYTVGSGVQDGIYGGLVAAYILTPPVTCPESFIVSIPDALSLDKGVDPNTVYPGYAQASELVLFSKVSGGRAPYNYLWNNGATSPDIRVGPQIGTNFTVTVTDAFGCRTTASKHVYAADVRCGNKNDKVSICQITPGNGQVKTICIATAAVAAQLKNGSRLGACMQGAFVSRSKEDNTRELSLTVWPNPSSGSFKLQINSAEDINYRLIVRDAVGRTIEQRKVDSKHVTEIGNSYGVGVYFVSLVGTKTVSVRIVKE